MVDDHCSGLRFWVEQGIERLTRSIANEGLAPPPPDLPQEGRAGNPFNPRRPMFRRYGIPCQSSPSHAAHRGPVSSRNGQQMINGMTAALGDHAIYLQLLCRGGRI
jgi:hypothetical protein